MLLPEASQPIPAGGSDNEARIVTRCEPKANLRRNHKLRWFHRASQMEHTADIENPRELFHLIWVWKSILIESETIRGVSGSLCFPAELTNIKLKRKSSTQEVTQYHSNIDTIGRRGAETQTGRWALHNERGGVAPRCTTAQSLWTSGTPTQSKAGDNDSDLSLQVP